MSIDPKRSQAVFQKLEQDLIKLSSKPRADNVHRFRTGTRRLQILLSELSPKLDRNQKKLLKLLGRIRKRAGKLRDLDVQLAALRSLKVPREPRRKTQLVNRLIELRGEQEKKLRKAVDDGTVREIRKRLKRAGKNFSPEASRDPLALARKMLEGIGGSDAPLSEALLHQYRIVTKRARYAVEFAEPSAEATQIVAGLKRIQDALGDWHDWLTLTQTTSEHFGEVRDSSLVAELHNVAGAKFRHAVSVLLHARAKLLPSVENSPRAAARPSARVTRPAASAA
ncbi:MAG: CHAD domain-containing protein [Candidatus Sulfotelmatobacter sp.]|jgi:CHAD domain-containing protein